MTKQERKCVIDQEAQYIALKVIRDYGFVVTAPSYEHEDSNLIHHGIKECCERKYGILRDDTSIEGQFLFYLSSLDHDKVVKKTRKILSEAEELDELLSDFVDSFIKIIKD